jgi:hypothetical protein
MAELWVFVKPRYSCKDFIYAAYSYSYIVTQLTSGAAKYILYDSYYNVYWVNFIIVL